MTRGADVPLKLDTERLYKNLHLQPPNVLKTVQLLMDQDREWFKQITVEYLRLCPPAMVDISDLDGDEEDSLSAIRIQADKSWSLVERELRPLAVAAQDLSDRLCKLSSSSTLLFQEFIKKRDWLESRPQMNKYPGDDDKDDAVLNAFSAIGYLFLPSILTKQVSEQSIEIIDDQIVQHSSTSTTIQVPHSQRGNSSLYPNMESEKAAELGEFARLCHSLADIAGRRKGSNSGNPMSDGDRSRWLIFKVADRLASIRTKTKPISPDHAAPIAQAIMNSVRDLDSQVVYTRTEGERAVKAWRAQKKTQK